MEQLTNLMAEQSVIGGVLLDANTDNAMQALETCKPEHFSYRDNAIAWQCITELFSNGQPIDFLTVKDMMETKGVQHVASFLGECIKGTPSQANLKTYANTVKKYGMLRMASGALNAAQSILHDKAIQIDDKINLALNELANIGADDGEHKIMNLVDHQAAALEKLQKIYEQGSNITGLTTGFENLDYMTGGLRSGDLIIVAARPSMGKTTLVMNMLERIAITRPDPQWALMFSLEMPSEQILQKVWSSIGGIPLEKILNAKLLDDNTQTARLGEAMRLVSRSKLMIDDKGGQHITQIQTRAKRMAMRFGKPAVIAVDYLQLIRAEGESQTIRIGNVSAGLKVLAKQMNCPVIALSQLNRAVTGKPSLMNLRDSGSIEQDADMVMFLHDEDYEGDRGAHSLTEIIFAKNRMGKTGSTFLQPELHLSRFIDTKRLPEPKQEAPTKRKALREEFA